MPATSEGAFGKLEVVRYCHYAQWVWPVGVFPRGVDGSKTTQVRYPRIYTIPMNASMLFGYTHSGAVARHFVQKF